MLLEFRARNYKSFAEEMIFSMIPAPKEKGLDYSVLSDRAGKKTYRGLSSAVIFGPNASGKSNIIGAMDTFRSIVVSGNIHPADGAFSRAASSLKLVSNCHRKGDATAFSVRFLDHGLLVEYALKADLGSFMEKDAPRKILEERLSVNEKEIFCRHERLEVKLPQAIRDYVNQGVRSSIMEQLCEIAEGSLSDTELFLTGGFKSIFAQKLARAITDWFQRRFLVVCRAEDMEPQANFMATQKTLREAARAFGIPENGPELGSMGEGDAPVSDFRDRLPPAELLASSGTAWFMRVFPQVLRALQSGGTLVMDAFDASIHPLAVMNIINIFHNDEINRHRAQLIFATHNPIYLDVTLLRKDEIRFVERDDETGDSSLYALSDFRAVKGIRDRGDTMDRYFVGRYGAIRDMDFAPVIEEIMTEER
ncbi:MAG: AAA family ATPase [Clostridia bacterium]|nr:AAA family ATPase [Clostridia bacterium]